MVNSNVDLSSMSEEELNDYKKKLNEDKKKLNEELLNIAQIETKIAEEKRRKEKEENNKMLEFLRENKDVILKILPKKHDRKSCDDNNLSNAYMEGGYPRCTRCMLLDILENDYMDDYKIDFSIKISEI